MVAEVARQKKVKEGVSLKTVLNSDGLLTIRDHLYGFIHELQGYYNLKTPPSIPDVIAPALMRLENYTDGHAYDYIELGEQELREIGKSLTEISAKLYPFGIIPTVVVRFFTVQWSARFNADYDKVFAELELMRKHASKLSKQEWILADLGRDFLIFEPFSNEGKGLKKKVDAIIKAGKPYSLFAGFVLKS
jgi:hypothetical protein